MGRARRPQPDKLPEKLKAIRDYLGIGQVEMANRVTTEKSLVTHGHISDFELGKRQPSLITLLRYSQMANVHMEVLVDDELELPAKILKRATRR